MAKVVVVVESKDGNVRVEKQWETTVMGDVNKEIKTELDGIVDQVYRAYGIDDSANSD